MLGQQCCNIQNVVHQEVDADTTVYVMNVERNVFFLLLCPDIDGVNEPKRKL